MEAIFQYVHDDDKADHCGHAADGNSSKRAGNDFSDHDVRRFVLTESTGIKIIVDTSARPVTER